MRDGPASAPIHTIRFGWLPQRHNVEADFVRTGPQVILAPIGLTLPKLGRKQKLKLGLELMNLHYAELSCST